MAIAMKCDRCGRFYDYIEGNLNAFGYVNHNIERDTYSVEETERYDLCPKCVVSLDKWLTTEDK